MSAANRLAVAVGLLLSISKSGNSTRPSAVSPSGIVGSGVGTARACRSRSRNDISRVFDAVLFRACPSRRAKLCAAVSVFLGGDLLQFRGEIFHQGIENSEIAAGKLLQSKPHRDALLSAHLDRRNISTIGGRVGAIFADAV